MFTFLDWLDELIKGHGHRYIKRIPYMTPKGRRYRYIYKVTHSHKGKQAMHEDHLDVGTKFMVHTESGKEVHGHIKRVDGDKVTYVIDDGADKGKEVTGTKAEILAMLNEKHGVEEKLQEKRDQLKADIEQAKKTGTEKQVARLEAQLKRLGGEPAKEKPVKEESTESFTLDIEALKSTIEENGALSGSNFLIRHKAKLLEGSLTADRLKEVLKAYEDHVETPLYEYLKKIKKKFLVNFYIDTFGYWGAIGIGNEKKGEIIDRIMHKILARAVTTDVIEPRLNTYSMDAFFGAGKKETRADRIKRLVREYTDEDAKKDIELHQVDIKAEKEKQEKEEEIVKDPQTLEDYKALEKIKAKRGEQLTDAERVKYNDLWSRDLKEKRATKKESSAPKKVNVGGFETFETKHTKTGKDLYVARGQAKVDRDEFNRLRSEAKALGGYYSSYSAVRGFIFPTPEARESFLKQNAGEDAVEGQDKVDPTQKRVEKLKDLLESRESKAKDTLNADRKTNTAKRAREARYATENAYAEIDQINNRRKILSAIESGKAYHLSEVSTLADMDMLESIINRIKYREAHDENSRRMDQGGLYQYGKVKDEIFAKPLTQEALEKESMHPNYLKMYDRDVKSLLSYLKTSDGKAKRGARTLITELNTALRLGEKEQSRVSVGNLKEVLKYVPADEAKRSLAVERITEHIKDHNRMLKLNIHSGRELFSALREYEDIVYARTPEEEKAHQDALKEKKKREDMMRRGEFARMNIPSYFPTPPKVIDRMIELAKIHEGETVLEPSAGAGHIADRLRAQGANVSAIEFNASLREYLESQGHEIVGNNALEHSEKYDHVIMNPPFEKQADVDHVTHAFKNNLVDGGRLVAVMSSSAMTRDNQKARDFQALVEKYGHYESLPEGTFKTSDRQTGVNTILVTLDLPVHGLEKSFTFTSAVDQLLKGLR